MVLLSAAWLATLCCCGAFSTARPVAPVKVDSPSGVSLACTTKAVAAIRHKINNINKISIRAVNRLAAMKSLFDGTKDWNIACDIAEDVTRGEATCFTSVVTIVISFVASVLAVK